MKGNTRPRRPESRQSISYLRVSGKGQVQGDGFPRQRASIEKYARGKGLEIVQEFRDEGVTGTVPSEDRPGLAALLEHLESNTVRTVLIERTDRLGRDLLVSEIILGQLRKLEVAVFDSEGTDLTVGDGDATRTLVRQVLGALAQFEKATIVSKLRVARERKRQETGRCEGAKPFGELPGETEVLERIRSLRRKRGGQRPGYLSISRTLNEEARPTRTGRPWHAETVRGIVARSFPAMR